MLKDPTGHQGRETDDDDDDDDDDDNFIAIYMYITRHTCNGMRFAPELLHSMPTIQSFQDIQHFPKTTFI